MLKTASRGSRADQGDPWGGCSENQARDHDGLEQHGREGGGDSSDGFAGSNATSFFKSNFTFPMRKKKLQAIYQVFTKNHYSIIDSIAILFLN